MAKLLLLALAVTGCSQGPTQTKPASSLDEFAAHIESLRAAGHIQALSAVISEDQSIAWSRSFGGTDGVPGKVGDTTVFHLASLTKPIASTVILQLVDEGKVSLDDPVSKYGIGLPATVLVRHLMSHTSEGVPGSRFAYNGDRFSLLDAVVAQAAGKPFAEAVQERIIAPLGLKRMAPTPQSAAFTASGLDKTAYLANVAPGYTWTGGRYVPTAYQTAFSTAAGLTASARDYAAFSMAMDRDAFLEPATKALAWTPVVGRAGESFPYGLGWFTRTTRASVSSGITVTGPRRPRWSSRFRPRDSPSSCWRTPTDCPLPIRSARGGSRRRRGRGSFSRPSRSRSCRCPERRPSVT
jgi:CubicO group peptidase (beta-lactamase class C family)